MELEFNIDQYKDDQLDPQKHVAYGKPVKDDDEIDMGITMEEVNKDADDTSKPTLYRIHVSATGLDEKIDTFCALATRDSEKGKYRAIAKTNIITNNKNPQWVESFQVSHSIDTNGELMFCVYKKKKNQSHLIGNTRIYTYQLAAIKDQANKDEGKKTMTLDLIKVSSKKKEKIGKITLIIEPIVPGNRFIELKMECDIDKSCLSSPSYLYKIQTIENSEGEIERQSTRKSTGKKNKKKHENRIAEKLEQANVYTFSSKLAKIENGKIKWNTEKILLARITNKSIKRANEVMLKIHLFKKKNKSETEIGSSSDIALSEFFKKRFQILIYTSKGKKLTMTSDLVVKRAPTLHDYLNKGVKINLVTAIDFTSSNGIPTSPFSLHACKTDRDKNDNNNNNNNNKSGKKSLKKKKNDNNNEENNQQKQINSEENQMITEGTSGMNPYETTIKFFGNILGQYDDDQLFDVYGFGARINGKVMHEFSLTEILHLKDERSKVKERPNLDKGIPSILSRYREIVEIARKTYNNEKSNIKFRFSGPTMFSGLIKKVSNDARNAWIEDKTYTVLLLITDGVISDMQMTIDQIVKSTDRIPTSKKSTENLPKKKKSTENLPENENSIECPLSIVIVGVGDADFSGMNALDADEVKLVSSDGHEMKRDIVQFLEYNSYSKEDIASGKLFSDTFNEIPRQMHQFCKTDEDMSELSKGIIDDMAEKEKKDDTKNIKTQFDSTRDKKTLLAKQRKSKPSKSIIAESESEQSLEDV